MTYIVIDTKNRQSEAFLEYVKTLSFVKVITGGSITTLKAMNQAKSGKTMSYKNAKNLMTVLNK